MRDTLKRLVPDKIRQRMNKNLPDQNTPETELNANYLLAHLYTPLINPNEKKKTFSFDYKKSTALPYKNDPFPLPSPELRMGYAPDNDEEYHQSGVKSSDTIRKILQEQKIIMDENTTAMDWGCATGRSLRHFWKEAQKGEFWGLEQDAPATKWNKENLSPPFHFLTCSAYPHLPFHDDKFTFVYGLSVFTHIVHFQDLWLMEFQRILKKNACAIFTIHDESTWDYCQKNLTTPWLPDIDVSKGLEHDILICQGHDWASTITFYRTEWIRKEWNQYLEVVDIKPMAEGYQTAIVLRKK